MSLPKWTDGVLCITKLVIGLFVTKNRFTIHSKLNSNLNRINVFWPLCVCVGKPKHDFSLNETKPNSISIDSKCEINLWLNISTTLSPTMQR